jgi:hypothetical protein
VSDDIDGVYETVARKLRMAKVIPVLGAGANLCGRPKDAGFVRGEYLPSGRELANYLARAVHYPDPEEPDLARVSQFLASTEGGGSLYDELHEVFSDTYEPTGLHRFLARLAKHVRTTPRPRRRTERTQEGMLFVTTNYDDALERAFERIEEPFEVLTYVAEGSGRGSFRHARPGTETKTVTRPNEYDDFDLEHHSLIVKIHGTVDSNPALDSFVITEDDYVDYISRSSGDFFPVAVADKLLRSHFLFLGYSLRDWNFRVMLYRLWGLQDGRDYRSWAIEANPDPIDRVAWQERGVDIVPDRLESFVVSMERRFRPDDDPSDDGSPSTGPPPVSGPAAREIHDEGSVRP